LSTRMNSASDEKSGTGKYPCSKITNNLISGIKKAWTKMSLEFQS
jgi:hypothetical protein